MNPVLAALDGLGVPYDVIPIDPAHADTEAFCRIYGYPLEKSANTIIVASKKEPKRFAACVVLADSRLDVNGVVRKHLGFPRASFATADEMRELTGMEVGGVTAFALPPGLPLLVDARILDLDWVLLGGGGRDLKVKVSPEAFRKLGAEPVDRLGLPRGAA